MLQRRDTRRPGRLFAETQELADLVAEPGQVPDNAGVPALGFAAISTGSAHFSNYITLRCIYTAAPELLGTFAFI